MKKPLVIFWGYQEVQNASGQIARTFWEHLPGDEFRPTILCADLVSSFKSSNRLYAVKDNILFRFFFKLLRRLKLKDFTMIPDIEYYSWNRRAYHTASKLLQTGEYDYIHTIATPMSSHLLGLQLKQLTGLPLVIQCNDPWHDTSGRKYKYQWCANRDLTCERKAAEGADVIIHSNQVIADIWAERYGGEVASKIYVVPFSFNIYNLPPVEEISKTTDKIVISHVGNIYSTRSSLTIFQGIEKLIKLYPEFKEKFVLKFIGKVHDSEKEYVQSHHLGGVIEYLGSIDPDSLSTYYLQTDVFLIIDVVIKRNGNYPSKLMMYYYYRKPILALTIPGSNLEKEMLTSGHTVCYYNDSDAICRYIHTAITEYDKLLNFNKDEWKKHTVENVKNIYKLILEKKGI